MFVLAPLHSIAPILLAPEMQPQEMVAHGAGILKKSTGGEGSFPDRVMVEGWQAEHIPLGTGQ